MITLSGLYCETILIFSISLPKIWMKAQEWEILQRYFKADQILWHDYNFASLKCFWIFKKIIFLHFFLFSCRNVSSRFHVTPLCQAMQCIQLRQSYDVIRIHEHQAFRCSLNQFLLYKGKNTKQIPAMIFLSNSRNNQEGIVDNIRVSLSGLTGQSQCHCFSTISGLRHPYLVK